MKTRAEKAIESFRGGLNCSQAVLTAYSGDLGFDNDLALSISCGFGGGMGRLQQTCGAVTGSFMVLGIYNCGLFNDNKERKEKTYSMIQKFDDRFKAIHNTTDCKALINCDIKSDKGHEYARENKLFEIVCERCIKDSMKIVDELTGM